MRKYRTLFVAALLVGGLLAWYIYRPIAPRLLKGPMVQNVGSDRLTLVWETAGHLPAEAELIDDEDGKSIPGKILESRGQRRAVEFTGLRQHHTYRYRLTIAGQILAEQVVHTAPVGDETFRFVAFGDSGEGGEFQYRIADRIKEAAPDLLIHTGDLVYPGGERSNYRSKFYRPNASVIAVAPLYPCPGNHDFSTEQSQPMFEEFVLPANGPAGQAPERHYWFDYGSARFISIDSNQAQDVLGTAVAPWLDQVLADAGDRWKFVYLHHPAYTHGKYEPTFRLHSTILPIMETRGVHVLFAGHDHMYQRSRPIRGGKVVAAGEGTIHVITGAGGAELYERQTTPSDLFEVVNNEKHSFTMVDVRAEQLQIRQIDIDGKSMDEFTVARKPLPTIPVQDAMDIAPVEESTPLPQTTPEAGMPEMKIRRQLMELGG